MAERDGIERIMGRHGGSAVSTLPTGAETPIAAAERLEP